MKKITSRMITIVAFCVAINYIGGNLALLLRLPIYLDSIGTIFSAALLGPLAGVITGVLSGLLSGATTDVFSLFFAPIQIITGLIAGLLLHGKITNRKSGLKIPLQAVFISFPGTVFSSVITALFFGGITSSGSSFIVQLFYGLGLNKVVSIILVQAGTDYLDRLLSVAVVVAVVALLPKKALNI
jgi:energy-coupling factor transport system substrate-specific component